MSVKLVRQVATGAAATAATIGLLAPVATAGADTLIPLRDTVKTVKIGGGTVTVSVKGQKAKLSPGMVALPTTRNAWVSGSITAKIDSSDADGGSIEAGYLVGCQVDVGGAEFSAGATADSGLSFDSSNITVDANGVSGNPFSVTPSVSGSTGGSISLGAGSVGTQALTYDRATWPEPGDTIDPGFADPATDYDFDGATGSLSYADQTIGVDGCAGYAQARLYVIVAAQVGNSQGTVVLWGPKFTLG